MRPDTRVECWTERPRTYRSTVVLGLAIAVGFALDLVLGGADSHLWAWLLAFVVVVGIDALSVRSSQRLRTIVVTGDELVVGERSWPRATIIGVDPTAGPGVVPVAPSPRRSTIVAVRTEGGVIGVPTTKPEELASALGFRAVPDLLAVRPASPEELIELPEVERRSDTLFAIAGIGPLPPAAPVEELQEAAAVLVAGRPPVGFARLEVVDGTAHLELLAVLPSHMRRGIGGALLEAACGWGHDQGLAAITLCTFAEVAWNGPFYARHGFVVVPPVGWTPGLVALRAAEVEVGLDALGSRVVMRRTLR